MNLIHKYYINNENFYNLNTLQSAVKFGIIFLQSEKVIASRGKLNLYKANDSTPLNRAFFVRNIRTVESLAVVPENLYKDTAEMIYKFLCVNRTQAHFNLCVISLNSTTEEQARLSLSADYRFIAVVARINPQNNRTLAALPTLSVSTEMEVAHG